MTEGKSVSAHRAQGQHPSEGCCPPGGRVGLQQGASLHKPTRWEGFKALVYQINRLPPIISATLVIGMIRASTTSKMEIEAFFFACFAQKLEPARKK